MMKECSGPMEAISPTPASQRPLPGMKKEDMGKIGVGHRNTHMHACECVCRVLPSPLHGPGRGGCHTTRHRNLPPLLPICECNSPASPERCDLITWSDAYKGQECPDAS